MPKYRTNVSLGYANRFRVGGTCDILFSPTHVQELKDFLSEFSSKPYFVLGAGSNTLIRDGGFSGSCIRLGPSFSYVERVEGTHRVRVGASTLNSLVSSFCAKEGIGGLSFLNSIPGRVGGALFMNAGCYGQETKDVVVYATYMNKCGEVKTLAGNEIPWRYRSCGLESDIIFLEAVLQGVPSCPEEIWQTIESLKANRQKSQPIYAKTCGSTFKNPPHAKAWQLIADAGCAGLQVGGAQMSPMHCNFIVNVGDATAQDIETLGEEVRKRVFEKHNCWLEWEIKIIGDKA